MTDCCIDRVRATHVERGLGEQDMKKSLKNRLRSEQLEARLMLTANIDMPNDQLNEPLSLSRTAFIADEVVALNSLNLGSIDGTETASGIVNRRNRSDDYSFRIEQSGETTIHLDGLNADVDIYLVDSSGQTVDRSLKSGRQSETIVAELDPGDYQLKVRIYRRRSASLYDLSITHQPHEVSEPADLAGNTMNSARDLGVLRGSMAYAHSITTDDPVDYYRFQIDGSNRVDVGLTGLSNDLDLYLYDSSGTVIDRSIGSGDSNESITRSLDEGEYYVAVVNYRNSVSGYTISLGSSVVDVPTLPPSEPVVQPHDPPVVDSNPTSGTPIEFPEVAYYGGNNDWNLNAIDAPESWAQGITGAGVTVAVVDSGVDWDHFDLAENIWVNTDEIAGDGIDNDGNGYVDDVRGWDFVYNDANPDDVNGHGTHVAGTIAAEMNASGATGVAFDAMIMPVRVLGNSGSGSTRAVAEGIRYAVDNGADVINLSLGGGYSSSILSAIQYADRNGVFVVAAAGNDGASVASYPALHSGSLSNVISVGAHNSTGRIAGFSNDDGGRAVQVDAPGVGIYSTLPNNRFGNYSGTSMAAPHVAGLAALIVSANPEISNSELRTSILNGADRVIGNSDSGGIRASSSLEQISITNRSGAIAASRDANASVAASGNSTTNYLPRRGRSRFNTTALIPALRVDFVLEDTSEGEFIPRNVIDQVFASDAGDLANVEVDFGNPAAESLA